MALLGLCLKLLFILELGNSLRMDPRLERVDRLLEEAYRMRNLRGLDYPQRENFYPINHANNMKINEVDLVKYNTEWTPNLKLNYGAESKLEELGLESDNELIEKFRKQKSIFKPKRKFQNVLMAEDNGEEEEEEEDYDGKQPEIVPIPHPVPIVFPKLIPTPLIIQHSFPYPMSLPNSLMNQRTDDPMNQDMQQMHRFMPNAFKKLFVRL